MKTKRIIAVSIDILFVAFAGVIIYFIAEIFTENTLIKVSLETIPIALLLSKDCLNGQSIGRSLMGIRVIDRVKESPINPLKSIIRNLFLIVWPLELIYYLLFNERICDKLLKTDVIISSKKYGFNSYGLIGFFSIWLILSVLLLTMMKYYPLLNLLYMS